MHGKRKPPRFVAAVFLAALPIAAQALPPGSSAALSAGMSSTAAYGGALTATQSTPNLSAPSQSFSSSIADSSQISGGLQASGQASLLKPHDGQTGSAASRAEAYAQGTPESGRSIGAAFALELPEPDAYAMLLAGLGVIGLIARRRIRNSLPVPVSAPRARSG